MDRHVRAGREAAQAVNGADELIAFLRARHDEIEATAKAAFGNSGQWWQRNTEFGPEGNLFEGDDPEGGYLSGTIVVYDEGSPTPDEFAHIALHDPAGVLADIAVKRSIVDAYCDGAAELARQESTGTADAGVRGGVTALRFVMVAFASKYNDHPDYPKQRLL